MNAHSATQVIRLPHRPCTHPGDFPSFGCHFPAFQQAIISSSISQRFCFTCSVPSLQRRPLLSRLFNHTLQVFCERLLLLPAMRSDGFDDLDDFTTI